MTTKKRIKKLSREMKKLVWKGTKPDPIYDPRHEYGRVKPLIEDQDADVHRPRYREMK